MDEIFPDQWKWLESTDDLQRNTYGYQFEWLTGLRNETDPPFYFDASLGDLAKYIFWNVFSAQQELAESAVEFSWKPWAVDDPFVNRQRIIEELVDACHFIGNILVGMGVTDNEWEYNYRLKQNKNRARAESGTYSAKKGGLGDGSDV